MQRWINTEINLADDDDMTELVNPQADDVFINGNEVFSKLNQTNN